jgi:2-C-methyl-D-erythritol 4-phosphate cytidylyltransferase/2-C-methyl-D-erythritol 2,4-cyclodiphosphate synthase
MPMHAAALIVAAGRGRRAGGGQPKQWRALAGRRVADWTLAAFAAHPDIAEVVLVIHPDDAAEVPAGLRWVAGGETRDASVRAGLAALQGTGATHVLIHDVARPCVSPAVIDAVLAALAAHDGAAPALPVTDALWRGADGRVTGTQPRDGLYRAQTPQGFRLDAILAAHQSHPGGAADDVEVARAAGIEVAIVPGDEANLKITLPEDFERAENYLRGTMDVRTGNGFDVHAFGPGDHVILCGVRIPHDRGLSGHSDADVGMHALTDALYGALAEGDIGRHFPPSDPQWKGADSRVFLRHAAELVRTRGYTLANGDVTLICERPKIGPHATEMQAELARELQVDAARISVKATTSERLGFTGREEGIAALATATLIAP